MMEIAKLIESEIGDFFAGFGHPGEPETPEEMQSQLLARVMPLLAGLEQEPVYQVQHGEHWRDLGKAQYDDHVNLGAEGLRILYAAPQLPQPAVPPEYATPARADNEWQNGYCIGWNACRADMLQGAEPVSQPFKLRDGWVAVPVEPTEDMIIHGFESEPDESFSEEKDWLAYEAMSGCQQAAHRAKLCWAAMIAAAPQQEAK